MSWSEQTSVGGAVGHDVPVPISGASLIVAWRLAGQHVLVIGGGQVAERRAFASLEADAKVTVVSTSVVHDLQVRIDRGELRYIQREFQESDLDGPQGIVDDNAATASTTTVLADADRHYDSTTLVPTTSDDRRSSLRTTWTMVMSAVDDPGISEKIGVACRKRGIPVNVADVPEFCDFYFVSTFRDKSLQVAVSTNGNGPRLARRLRMEITGAIPPGSGQAIENVGVLRQKIRQVDGEHAASEKRMKWMSQLCDTWSIPDLAELSEPEMEELVRNYLKETIPKKIGKMELQEVPTPTPSSLATTPQTPNHKGKLILVGAGPGDPDLLTRKALRALNTCDVVVADNLIPKAILEEIPRNVEVLTKPLVHGHVEDAQNNSNEWVLSALQSGKTVVRLKGGDPFLFGRGGEELNHFRGLGYETEVIPGISSALCAPLIADIPVTHRATANQVLISTGRGEKGSFPDMPPFSEKRTLVLLMGVKESAKVVSELLKIEYPPHVPVAVVQQATMPGERVMRCTLGTLTEMVKVEKIEPPATFIIGNVVNVCNGSPGDQNGDGDL